MKKINDRFYITDNNIVFDTESSFVAKIGDGSLDESLEKLAKKNINCNYQTLKKSKYADGSNFAININLTSACNLNCTYCFARGGDYGDQKDNMGATTLPALRELILKNVTSSNKVRFEYFGGEPLLNESMIKKLVSFANELEKETGIKVLHRVSTNLTFLSDVMLDILCDNDFVVSVSIDGIKEIQDSQRPSRNGKSTYDTIIKNVERIKNKKPTIKTVARMTVAQEKITIFENVMDLVKTGLFDYVSLYPASVLSEDGSYKYYFDEEIRAQYKELFHRYNELFAASSCFKGFLEVEKTLDELLNGKLSINHCSAGGNYCTISSDNSIVTCHRLCGKEEYMMNTSELGGLDQKIRMKWSEKVNDSETCKDCFAKYICGGGCKQEHLSSTGDIRVKNKNACNYRKFFIEEIIANIELLAIGFQNRYIPLDDMFVYCGRPIVENHREKIEVSKGMIIIGE